MSFEKGTGCWQITKKVLDDYEKKNPMTEGSKESDYLSDIVVEVENIYWEKHPTSKKGEMEFFELVYDRLIAEIRKIIATKEKKGEA